MSSTASSRVIGAEAVLGAEAVHGTKAVCRAVVIQKLAFGILALAWRRPRLGRVIGAEAVLGAEAVHRTKVRGHP